jgi:beta-N-acetylhexosaminidase
VVAAAALGGVLTSGGHHAEHSSATAAAGPPSSHSSKAGSAKAHSDQASLAPLPGSATKLLGQRIMVGMSGQVAPSWLLRAVRAGQVGSVILFAPNIASRGQTVALTNALQRAARAGGNPKLLIAVDQEGGEVKRIPSGPPTLSPPQMAATNKVSVANSQGRATGQFLKRWGINMDLAPVSDVPTFGRAFIWQQGRAFSFNAAKTANFATAFAQGLQSAGVAATGKHFPGLGSAPTDTDFRLQELHPTAVQRAAALKPYERMIPRGLDAVLVALAGFPAYDRSGAPAALSRPIIQGVLRDKLHFRGVTLTDALGAPTGHSQRTAGVLAAIAGSDILLYTNSAPGELGALKGAMHTGKLSAANADGAYRRIAALKHKLGLA